MAGVWLHGHFITKALYYMKFIASVSSKWVIIKFDDQKSFLSILFWSFSYSLGFIITIVQHIKTSKCSKCVVINIVSFHQTYLNSRKIVLNRALKFQLKFWKVKFTQLPDCLDKKRLF